MMSSCQSSAHPPSEALQEQVRHLRKCSVGKLLDGIAPLWRMPALRRYVIALWQKGVHVGGIVRHQAEINDRALICEGPYPDVPR